VRNANTIGDFMAKFKRDRSEARGKVLTLRVSATEYEWLLALMAERGLKLSELLREALDDYARKHGRKAKS
jgi:hypothetical protein